MASSTGIHRTAGSKRSDHRRLFWEQCEERVALSANGTEFVTSLYHDILHRAPDQIGLDSYKKALSEGASETSIVTSIWNSAEHRGIQVDGFYQTLLHRTADPGGRQFYVDQMLGGTADVSVMFALVTSAEYVNRNPIGEAYLTALYRDVLGRNSDSEGLQSWQEQLVLPENQPGVLPQNTLSLGIIYSRTYQGIASSFITSHERHLEVVDSYYANYLGRPADSAGEADWVQRLDQGPRQDAWNPLVSGSASTTVAGSGLIGSMSPSLPVVTEYLGLDEDSVAIKFLSSAEYLSRHPLA